VRTVLDLFSGTSRVGHALSARLPGAPTTTTRSPPPSPPSTSADRRRWLEPAQRVIAELEALPGEAGWFTETFCVRSRYLQPGNGARVDAIRERIARLALEPELEAIALVSLMEAADRVDSTVGVQMAYLKRWAARSAALAPGAGAARRQGSASCASTRGPLAVPGRPRLSRSALQSALVSRQRYHM
jgi:adenine-specific DNA-methyltransferase